MWHSQGEVELSENQGMSSSPRIVEAGIMGQNLWIVFVYPEKIKRIDTDYKLHTQVHTYSTSVWLLSSINILVKHISALIQKGSDKVTNSMDLFKKDKSQARAYTLAIKR